MSNGSSNKVVLHSVYICT